MEIGKDFMVLNHKDFTFRVKLCIELLFNKENIEPIQNFPIEVSTRMTRTHGYFQYSRNKKQKTYKALKLNFSHKLLNGSFKNDYVNEIILHEVLHYLVFNLGYYEEKHGYIFQKYCKKYGCRLTTGSSSEEYSNKEGNEEQTKKVACEPSKYTINCSCGFKANRTRTSKIIQNIKNYRCPTCKGSLSVTQNF